MPIIRYGEGLNVLVAAKGHPYLRDSFMAIFDEMEGVAATLVEQPAAACMMCPGNMKGYDALVLYDMPGLDFRTTDPPAFIAPDPAFKANFLKLLENGIGVVALHHAIAGWPAWDEYAELLGGRFLYKPGMLRGEPRMDSGYRHDVAHDVVPAGESHPVLDGIDFPLRLTDELYLFEVFEDSVQPLLRSRHSFVRDNFYSAAQAVSGKMFSNENWTHPEGSSLVGWVKRACNSPLVYLQPGDGPTTYQNPGYRRLVANAIRWVSSEKARIWARGKA